VLYAGTSGFSYPAWRGGFYPAGAKPSQLLRLYAERLGSVELNATFYRLPSEEQLRRWAGQTPPGFRFAVKTSRRITHFGDLSLVGTFCERVHALGERLGPVLVQLPPTRPRDDGFLRLLLGSLDPELRYAVEFRHESWDAPEVDVALARAGAVRMGALEAPAPFRYLRLREPPYDEAALAAWAARLRPLLEGGVDVYCYFKHEDDPRGALYAERLRALTELRP
jgi:uncharacterized protein YecE (DUF72 family)